MKRQNQRIKKRMNKRSNKRIMWKDTLPKWIWKMDREMKQRSKREEAEKKRKKQKKKKEKAGGDTESKVR